MYESGYSLQQNINSLFSTCTLSADEVDPELAREKEASVSGDEALPV